MDSDHRRCRVVGRDLCLLKRRHKIDEHRGDVDPGFALGCLSREVDNFGVISLADGAVHRLDDVSSRGPPTSSGNRCGCELLLATSGTLLGW